MTTPRFLQIHTLTSYTAALLNRDDSGLAKRLPYGGVKIADEFIHPKPPGHVLVMLKTAEAFGLTNDEILREPMLPECRAILDFKR